MKHLVSLYLCCSLGQVEDGARREAERGGRQKEVGDLCPWGAYGRMSLTSVKA